MNSPARAAWLLAGLLAASSTLPGCASWSRPGQRSAGDSISGRLSVRVEGTDQAAPRALNAAFELEGDAKIGSLKLATPLGTTIAQLSWGPGLALLVTPQEETPYADLDSLTAQFLGESVPVGALFDWLRGRPWPAAPSQVNPVPAEPGFRQLGWEVNLATFDAALVSARRERAPVVTVRAKVDRP
ncbi:MAG: lipoprotein insertase outer membrane protein LolB [Burkholderiaceae bacterium]